MDVWYEHKDELEGLADRETIAGRRKRALEILVPMASDAWKPQLTAWLKGLNASQGA